MASSSGKEHHLPAGQEKVRRAAATGRRRDLHRTVNFFHEIGLIVLFVAMLILFCCNFGIIGPVGNAISGVLFGIFDSLRI